uniref:Uncharacterized protein n=1 Tax=Wuchereria bancrofti TaxID=6293 RepID=A0AAF5PJI9_WUCBA
MSEIITYLKKKKKRKPNHRNIKKYDQAYLVGPNHRNIKKYDQAYLVGSNKPITKKLNYKPKNIITLGNSLNNPKSLIQTSTENSLFSDYDERSWFGESGVPNLARDPIAQFLALLKKPQTMGNLEAFIRMDDQMMTACMKFDCMLMLIASSVKSLLKISNNLMKGKITKNDDCLEEEKKVGKNYQLDFIDINFTCMINNQMFDDQMITDQIMVDLEDSQIASDQITFKKNVSQSL